MLEEIDHHRMFDGCFLAPRGLSILRRFAQGDCLVENRQFAFGDDLGHILKAEFHVGRVDDEHAPGSYLSLPGSSKGCQQKLAAGNAPRDDTDLEDYHV